MVQVTTTRGRTIKFTPERIEQIKNLVERGMSREDIATMIGVTVGSLQVTCSRLNISLRRPKHAMADSDNGPPKPKLISLIAHRHNGDNASWVLVLRLHGREREFPLKLSTAEVNELALRATVRGMSVPEFIAELLRQELRR